jgi:dienelactone hydrolase
LPASADKVALSIHIQGSDILLNWPSAIGQSYDLEHATNLASPVWQNLAISIPQNPSGTNSFLRVGALNESSNGFFRISSKTNFTFSLSGTNFTYADAQRTFTGIMLKPSGNGPFPAVVIQHGAGGTANGYSLQKANEMMPWGLVCIGPTLTHAAGGETNPANMGFCSENLERARACLNILCSLSYVDTNRLAIFGHSMGAFATIGDASALAPRLRGCAISSGGVIPDSAGTNNAAPTVSQAAGVKAPFLMFACDADPVVPPMRSQLFQQQLNSNAVPNLRILYSSNSIPNPTNWHNIHQDPAINADILTNTFQWFRSYGVLP